MKTLFFSILLLAVTTMSQAQEIVLEEAKVGFAPLNAKITQDGDAFSYKIHEDYDGEFAKDPIAFMIANFDIANFIIQNEKEDYDSYQITFKSAKGSLKADYDKEGNLVGTFQKFKNVVMPLNVRRMVYANYKGWTVKENKYIASGNSDLVEKELYKLKLERGNEKQRVKLDPRSQGSLSVASN